MSAGKCCRVTSIFVLIVLTVVDCATVYAPNKSGILNEGLMLTCSYTLEIGETFDSLTWARKRNSDAYFIDIVKFGSGGPIYYTSAFDLRNRSTLSKVTNGGNINITMLICVDEAQFRCTVEYTTGGTLRNQQSTMVVTIHGRPEKPDYLIKSPGEYAEYDILTFDCRSVVGKAPLGIIKWEGIRGSVAQDISGDSEVVNERVTPGSCTRTFISRLTRNVTRNDNGLVIRCRTTHTIYQDPEDYLDSPHLVVNFPVDAASLSVSQEPDLPVHDVGNRVRLVCRTTSVPASTYIWRHLKSNKTYKQGIDGVMDLVNVQEDQDGTYECEATNSYLNLTFTAKKTITVNIRKPTAVTPCVTRPTTEQATTQKVDYFEEFLKENIKVMKLKQRKLKLEIKKLENE